MAPPWSHLTSSPNGLLLYNVLVMNAVNQIVSEIRGAEEWL